MGRLIAMVVLLSVVIGCGSGQSLPSSGPTSTSESVAVVSSSDGQSAPSVGAPAGAAQEANRPADPCEELCRQTLDPATRTAALGKLRSDAPHLFDPVRKLTTVETLDDRLAALAALRSLAAKGRAAVPVIEWVGNDAATRLRQGKLEDFAYKANVRIVAESLRTWAAVAATEARTVDALSPYLRATAIPVNGTAPVPCEEVRTAAAVALGSVHGAPRPAALRAVRKGREDAVAELIAAMKGGTESPVYSIARYEESAGPALDLLNDLSLKSKDANVQRAADAAIDSIRKHVAAAVVVEKLGPDPSPVDLWTLLEKSADPLVVSKVEWLLPGGPPGGLDLVVTEKRDLFTTETPEPEYWKRWSAGQQGERERIFKALSIPGLGNYEEYQLKWMKAAADHKEYKGILLELDVMTKRRSEKVAPEADGNQFRMQDKLKSVAQFDDLIWTGISHLPEPGKSRRKAVELKALEERTQSFRVYARGFPGWPACQAELQRQEAYLKDRQGK